MARLVTILGCHDGHNSSACLLQDGVLTHAVQEERFLNVKNTPGMPVNSIEWILKEVHEPLDMVALATRFIHKPDWYRAQGHYEKATSWNRRLNRIIWPFKRRLSSYYRNRLDERRKLLRNILMPHGFEGVITIVVDHHTAHATSAYYGSHYGQDEPVTVITADGSGDGLSATVNIGLEDGCLSRLDWFNSTRNESIGNIYSLTTHYLGFTPWEHEYKLMGMAPYSAPRPEIVRGLAAIAGVEKGRFTSTTSTAFVYDRLKKLYYRQRFDWICASLQEWFECVMTEWVDQLLTRYKLPGRLACAGGDFMNVKANMVISQRPKVKDMFIFPSAGDESLSIGAAMKVYADWCLAHGMNPKKEIKPIGPLYLGPPACGEESEAILKEHKGIEFQEWDSKSIPTLVSELLEEGEIIARCSGRMEFGARALGNRSIMADATNLDVKTPLNAAIKQRDFWMPFAPTVMMSERKRLLENPKDIASPYMIMAFPSTLEGREELKAAMHPYDCTLRPQILEKEWNPEYWRILADFRRKTKNGGILNTSFNLHGYPIALDLSTALWTLENSGLKYLVAENWLIEKKG